MVDQQAAAQCAKLCDSFYLYDERSLTRSAQTLRDSFPGIDFLYSVKCNPHPLIIKALAEKGFGADAASLGEVLLSRECGLAPEDIYYSAPGKTPEDLARAVDLSTVIADSPGEVERLQALAQSRGITLKIGVRINPDFTLYTANGSSSKFGIDEETVFSLLPTWNALPNIRIVGLHVHCHSQELDAAILRRYHENVLALARRFSAGLATPLDFVNLGSGIGVPFTAQDRPVDVAALGKSTSALAAAFQKEFPGVRVLIESGRYATSAAGTYVSKVVDKKVSRGKTYVLLASTLNAFLRPAVNHMVEGQNPGKAPDACEPLYTGGGTVEFLPLTQTQERETVTLCGSLCTAADIVAEDISLPRLSVGDLVAIPNAGSYAYVLSPTQFAHLPLPRQFFICSTGQILES